MGGNLELSEKEYLTGKSLGEARFIYGNPDLIEAYLSPSNLKAPDLNNKGFSGALLNLSNSLQELQNTKFKKDDLINRLNKEILELIKKGDLIAFGFKSPRDLNDKPIKIPTDLFLSVQANWDNSELLNKQFEFTGIRLFKNLNAGIKPDQKNAEIPNSAPAQPRMKNFADLDPELHIDENKAAEILGISPRTLQGYRVKGGGPIFLKLKKSVRYKIKDLKNWIELNKKNNTSE